MRDWFFEQMAMYSAYHRDGRNQATHHIGVPMIVFSLMILLGQVVLVETMTGPVTLSGVLIVSLMLIYIYCAPMVGTLAVLFYGPLLFGAEYLCATLARDALMMIFAASFVGGWVIQFIGHGFEGRKPALFDNLLQIFMAPSFLMAEILFALGFEGRLKREIQQRMPRYLPGTAEGVGSGAASDVDADPDSAPESLG